MGKPEPRQMLMAERKLWGHDSTGPRGVFDQSTARISDPVSPPPARTSEAEVRPGGEPPPEDSFIGTCPSGSIRSESARSAPSLIPFPGTPGPPADVAVHAPGLGPPPCQVTTEPNPSPDYSPK